jgi:hypothetical protein
MLPVAASAPENDGSPETYRLLVTDRGWSGSRFEPWYGETLALLLLSPVDHSRQEEES